MDRHIAVNFHYVGMPDYPHPGIYGLARERFREMVEGLCGDYEPVSLEQVLEAAAGRGVLPERSCLISFDDGLTCQFNDALPILDDLGVPAAFFVSGQHYERSRGLQVHRVHWTRAMLGDARVILEIGALHEAGELPSHPSEVDVAEAKVGNFYDTDEQAQLKFYLNYLCTPDQVEIVLARLMTILETTDPAFVADYYFSQDMLRALADRGWVGAHGHSHRPLARMTPTQREKEFSGSKALLESMTGTTIRALSYPFGTPDAVDRVTAEDAKRAGFELGYTMEMAYNADLSDPLLLARVDAADVEKIADLELRNRYQK